MKTLLSAVAVTTIMSFGANAQTNDSITIIPKIGIPALQFSGYVETYYAYDFGQPESNTRPGFFYSHTRHNEVALNLGFIKAA